MGSLYSIFVLDDIVNTDDGLDWLEKWGTDIPDPRPESREPTLGEIIHAIETLEDYDLDFHVGAESMQVTISNKISDKWASLVIMDYQKDNENLDHPYDFFFEGGWIDLIREIIQHLADICGPLILTQNGENPEILLPY